MAYLVEQNVDGVGVLSIRGSLVSSSLSTVEVRFDQLARGKEVRCVVEMSEVEAVTTPAITVMLRTALAVRRNGGRMVFAHLRPEVERTFSWCRLDRVLELQSGEINDVVKALAPPLVKRCS